MNFFLFLHKGVLFCLILAVINNNCLGNKAESQENSPNPDRDNPDIYLPNEYLLKAASQGLIAEVKKALNQGANINAQDSKLGNTPLMFAAANGHKEVVDYLLLKGANITTLNLQGDRNALLWATYYGHNDIIEILVKKGAKVNSVNIRGDTAFHVASYQGNIKIVRRLYELGAKFIIKSKTYGYTALHLAASKGHSEVIEFLLSKNVDINVVDKSGKSAIMLAAINGHDKVLEKLIETKKVDLDIQDLMGFSALHLASKYNHTESAIILLEAGCKIDLSSQSDDSALNMAIKNSNLQIVQQIALYDMNYFSRPIIASKADKLAQEVKNNQILHFLRQFNPVN